MTAHSTIPVARLLGRKDAPPALMAGVLRERQRYLIGPSPLSAQARAEAHAPRVFEDKFFTKSVSKAEQPNEKEQ